MNAAIFASSGYNGMFSSVLFFPSLPVLSPALPSKSPSPSQFQQHSCLPAKSSHLAHILPSALGKRIVLPSNVLENLGSQILVRQMTVWQMLDVVVLNTTCALNFLQSRDAGMGV